MAFGTKKLGVRRISRKSFRVWLETENNWIFLCYILNLEKISLILVVCLMLPTEGSGFSVRAYKILPIFSITRLFERRHRASKWTTFGQVY